MAVDIVILAAGKGKRMKSNLPKVLHTLGNRTLLEHVLDSAESVPDAAINIVTGHGDEQVKAALGSRQVHWVRQERQLGTGHAVQQALPYIRGNGLVLVLYGDVPLIRPQTLMELIAKVKPNTLALLTANLNDPSGYGRIVRDESGSVRAIVEEKDATAEQRAITEINTGIMALPTDKLKVWLPKLSNQNAQGEYYLTDLVAMAVAEGCEVSVQRSASPMETEGVNSRQQLHDLERYWQQNLARALQDQGVTIADTNRFDCRGTLSCGEDSFIDINAVFEGRVSLGAGVHIGPNCCIRDAVIGDQVQIKAHTVIEGPVTIGDAVEVGPFARLRPGTVLGTKARIGNFVETKKVDIGAGSKVNHLSYIGDAHIGEGVNIGAGTITCNYDGVNKFKTKIGDGAFIGSNTSLVAPVDIGRQATVGAGSTITRDVEADCLAVARGRQKNIDGWKRPQKKDKG